MKKKKDRLHVLSLNTRKGNGFIAKLCILLFFLSINSLYAKENYNQTTSFTIKAYNATLNDIFDIIRKQSNFEIFYNNDQINTHERTTVNVKNGKLSEVLDQALKNKYIYEIRDNYILISKKGQDSTQKNKLQEKEIVVKGNISDETGEPLSGVSIVIPGTTTGTITDINGNYSILIPGAQSKLQFSYIGFNAQEIVVGNRSTINIILHETPQDLDEVVIIGYGAQKKINLTGSVGAVKGDDISSRPVTSVSSGLQGLLPGVTVVSNANGNLPGQSGATIRVRGIGTIGNANPLILVDGVEGSINLLNPEDIESISVLKDAASSSIYGARGANGVVLITTKSALSKEMTKPSISFNGYYGIQTPTRLPEMLSAADYIKLDMEATANVGKPANYTQEHLDKVLSGTDPDYFSNSDWIGAVFRNYAPQQNYNVNVTGSSPLMGYYISYGYMDQEGLTVGQSVKSKRHNIRTKLNTTIASILDLNANISYTKRNYSTPSGGIGGDNGDGGAIYTAMSISPVIPIKFTDGGWGYGGGSANPVALLYDSGTNDFISQEISSIFTGKLNFSKFWNALVTYSFVESNSYREILSKTINYYRPGTTDIWYTTNPTNKLDVRDYTSNKQTLIAQTNFEKTFGNHSISALAGFSQEWYTEKNFTAQRTNLSTEKNPTLNFGSKDTQTNSSSAASWALRSGFGRINYGFMDRYLLEANIRYDLSSRFAKENRGGIFPSISGAWRVSEENFFKNLGSTFDNVKIRASYGLLGNQYVGSNEYPYLAIVGIVSTPRFGTIASDGYTQTSLPNPNLSWESIEMTDIGIDIGMLNNRLNFTGDIYVKKTKDILLQLTYPSTLGLTPTEQNAGIVKNTGWEIDIRWNDKIGKDWRYGASLNLSDVRNKIVDFGGLAPSITNAGHSIRRVGDPIDAFYGYIYNGLAMPEDFEKYNPTTGRYENPKFPVLDDDKSYVQPGDIKLRDLDGDGNITADKDREVIGSSIPRYTYLFRGDLGWKGIDFSFIVQGVGKADGLITGRGNHAFINQSTYPQKVHLDRWSFENPNPNAKYPRLTFDEDYNQRFSSFWLEDASYLRLKNISLGYTFHHNLIKKFNIEKLRIYFSADNLLTLSDFFYAYDPETPRTSGGYYPQTKTFVLGFNLSLK